MFFVESQIFQAMWTVNANRPIWFRPIASDVAARVGIEAILNMTLGGNETPAV